MASSKTIIDTGQSLGKNLKIQDGKLVALEPPASVSADIMTRSTDVLANTAIESTLAAQLSQDKVLDDPSLTTGRTVESKSYFTTPGQVVELHSDSVGQTYLTIRGNSFLSSLLIGAVVLGYAFLVLRVLSTTRTKKVKKGEVVEQNVVESSPVHKVRRLTL